MADLTESRSMSTQRVSTLAGVTAVDVKTANVDAAVHLAQRRDMAMVQVFARKQQSTQLASTLAIGSQVGMASVTADYTALPLGPGQWMLTSTTGDAGEFCQQIRARTGELGYVSEQSQSRVIIRVSGPSARQLMQKGCRLDLHPSFAGEGFCAQTPMAQVGVLMHQLDDAPSYDLHVYSGFARSFWHWLTESAAQYGYTVS